MQTSISMVDRCPQQQEQAYFTILLEKQLMPLFSTTYLLHLHCAVGMEKLETHAATIHGLVPICEIGIRFAVMQSGNHGPIGMDRSNSNFTTFINDDLIVYILLRLPVKSLFRFCAVCKSWKTLIRSDDFIKSHLKQSLQNYPNNFNNKFRIYSESEFRKNHMWADVFSSFPPLFFVGSCNGVLCYYSKSSDSNLITVHLWNPATRSFRSLPEGYCRNNFNEKVLVIFAFDPLHDDYKVLKIYLRKHKNSRTLETEVYSLRTNSWKIINLNSWSIRRNVSSNIIFHNGALHCIAISALTQKHVLGVFNLDEQRNDEVTLPGTDFKKKPLPRLGPFGEFLSLSIWREREFEVWVMKEYGVWTKQFVLAYSPFVHSPYGITVSGKLLAVNWMGEDVIYDAERQSVEKYVHNKVIFLKENVNYKVPETDDVVVADYVESMVSVFPPPQETGEPNA